MLSLMVTFGSPINIDGKFLGIIATDALAWKFAKYSFSVKHVEGSYAFLVSNKGVIASHPSKEPLLNKNIKDLSSNDFFESRKILEKIQSGTEFNFIKTDELGNKQLICFAPITAGKILTPYH